MTQAFNNSSLGINWLIIIIYTNNLNFTRATSAESTDRYTGEGGGPTPAENLVVESKTHSMLWI
jgi:hypothetical protein